MSLLTLKYNDNNYEIDFDNVKNQIIIVDKSSFAYYISPELTKKYFELSPYRLNLIEEIKHLAIIAVIVSILSVITDHFYKIS